MRRFMFLKTLHHHTFGTLMQMGSIASLSVELLAHFSEKAPLVGHGTWYGSKCPTSQCTSEEKFFKPRNKYIFLHSNHTLLNKHSVLTKKSIQNFCSKSIFCSLCCPFWEFLHGNLLFSRSLWYILFQFSRCFLLFFSLRFIIYSTLMCIALQLPSANLGT